MCKGVKEGPRRGPYTNWQWNKHSSETIYKSTCSCKYTSDHYLVEVEDIMDTVMFTMHKYDIKEKDVY